MRRLSCLGLMFLLGSGSAHAATLIVEAGGGGDYVSIQPALSAAATGDTILIASGTYAGADDRDLDFGGKNLAMIGLGGRSNVIIDCEGAGRALRLINGETSAALVEGITFRNGLHSSYGGAIYCYGASLTVRDCAFEGNSATQGGAVYSFALGGPMQISSCVFQGNTGSMGGAIFSTGSLSPQIDGCSFLENHGDVKGGALYVTNYAVGTVQSSEFVGNGSLTGGAIFLNLQSSPLIDGCFFSENSAQEGGAIGTFNSCAPEIVSCTFVHNSAPQGSSVHWNFACNGSIRQSILAFGLESSSVACSGSSPVICHNLVWSNGSQNLLCGNYYENLYQNPEFCGLANQGPYTLQSDSPAAAGNNVYGLLMGCLPVDCGDSAATPSSWSEVKCRY